MTGVDLRNAQTQDEQLYDVDVGPDRETDPAKLAEIIDKSRALLRADRRVDAVEKVLKRAKERMTYIASNELPKLMKDASLLECPLGKGWAVKLNTLVTASVPAPDGKAVNAKERHEKGIAYLDDVAPDLVVHTVVIRYARGNEKQLKKLLTNLARYKPPVEVEVKAAVHSGTLGKWVRGQDALGKAVDEVALGVNRIPTAELVEPKRAKDKV